MPDRFTKSKIHTSNQPGPPSPYAGERRHTTKVSSATSNVIVGNAQECCVTHLDKYKVSFIGGDGLTNTKGMHGEHGAEPACLSLNIDKPKRNQCNSNVDDGRRAESVCQSHVVSIPKQLFILLLVVVARY